MKNVILVLSLLIYLTSCNGTESIQEKDQSPTDPTQETLKRYEIASGIVKYKTSTTGKILGSTTNSNGTESLFFKNYGALELLEVESTETIETKIFGSSNKETNQIHSMSKLDNGDSYHVDYKRKTIIFRKDMAMEMVKNYQPNKDAGAVGMEMLENIGGKMTGKDKFLSYECEIWEAMGSKQWIYKGLTLKFEMNVMGIKTTKEATSVQLDINVPDKHFKLPDYPLKTMDEVLQEQQQLYGEEDDYDDEIEEELTREEMEAEMKAFQKMTFKQWKALVQKDDPELQQMSDEDLKYFFDRMKKKMNGQ